MLPPNFLTIPQIQHERHASSKLMHLTTLLEFVLKIYNPNVTAAEEGKEPKVGERVIACQHIFDNFTRVLWALKVRNSFAHVIEGASFSEQDHRNAVDCLIEAIGDVCRQAAIPRALVEEIYRDPDADLRSGKELEARSTIRRAIGSGLRKLVVLALLGIGGFFFWPKAVMLYKGDPASASVVRTEAELALKQVKERRKQREYSASINQIDTAWRNGEIEFRRGNYRRAEEKYRQLIGFWDSMKAQIAETSSFEELQAEVNTLRQTAKSAEAPQKAAVAWNQAEDLRRNAVTARKNGNILEAKKLIIQARQQYELAKATAMTQSAGSGPAAKTPATTPTMKPEPVRPLPTVFSPPAVEKPPEPTPPQVSNNEDEIFTIEEKEFMRYVIKRVNPVISPQAKSAGVSGAVVIEVWLSKASRLSKATVVRGDPLLQESALAALRQWSFRPYRLDRVPTDIRSEITIYVR